MKAEAYMQKVIRKKGVLRGCLWVLSTFYQVVIALKNWAYQMKLLPVKKVGAVVISVGNVTAGGTGKTPFVHFLAQQLSSQFSVAILSRGYQSQAGRQTVPIQVFPHMQAEVVGDEPLWLCQQLPSVQVWVGKDRFQSAQQAVARGAQILILDDGFQHRRLHRDFDVVVLPAHKPFDNGYFLPRGYLRDFPSRLKQAHLLAVMGRPLLPFLEAPSVIFRRSTPVSLAGKKVALFCAIANPSRFIQQVKAVQGVVVGVWVKPDHAAFSCAELNAFFAHHSPDLLVCTEKDHVKLSQDCALLPLLPLPLQLEIQEGKMQWETFIHQIQLQVDHVRRISRCSP
ncbi:MAG: tetraacyldisaccharide 4'-kinase [Candidatus Rhabdochlamydia sp.]